MWQIIGPKRKNWHFVGISHPSLSISKASSDPPTTEKCGNMAQDCMVHGPCSKSFFYCRACHQTEIMCRGPTPSMGKRYRGLLWCPLVVSCPSATGTRHYLLFICYVTRATWGGVLSSPSCSTERQATELPNWLHFAIHYSDGGQKLDSFLTVDISMWAVREINRRVFEQS